jgi:hypothetical protein
MKCSTVHQHDSPGEHWGLKWSATFLAVGLSLIAIAFALAVPWPYAPAFFALGLLVALAGLLESIGYLAHRRKRSTHT